MKSLYPPRTFRLASVTAKDGQTVEVPADVYNLDQIRPYTCILIVRSGREWRFVCEYWDESVAQAQAKLFESNPANNAVQILPYPQATMTMPPVLLEPPLELPAKPITKRPKKTVVKVLPTVEKLEEPDPTVLPEPIKAHRRGRKVTE